MAEHPRLLTLIPTGAGIGYTLDPGEAFRPETLTGYADGSGAGTDFVVQATMYAPTGEILSRTRTDDVVTAGDSGEFTLAPF